MRQQRKTDQQQHARDDGNRNRPRDEQRALTKGQDQIARDMGRGESRDHGRDQTAREMSKGTRTEGNQRGS
jgi:hypothetical protein